MSGNCPFRPTSASLQARTTLTPLSNRKKITWYYLEYILNGDGYLIFLSLFVLFIGFPSSARLPIAFHIARYAPLFTTRK